MKLGCSHTVYVVVPEGIKVTLPSPTIIIVFGTDEAKVGQFAADIREKRKPEPYKGKLRPCPRVASFGRVLTHHVQGVFVGDEKIKMKSGKKK